MPTTERRRRGRVSGPTSTELLQAPPPSLGGTLRALKQQSPSPRRAGSTSGRSPTAAPPLPASAVRSPCCSSLCPVGRMAPGRCGHSTESRRAPGPSTVPRSLSPVAGDGGGRAFCFVCVPCSLASQRRAPLSF